MLNVAAPKSPRTPAPPSAVGEPKNMGPFVRPVPKPRKPAPPKPKLGTPGNPYRIPDLPPGVTPPGAPSDPFAATPANVLQSQAAQQIQAIYDPIIAQLKDAAQSAITSGSNAITGYTSALADRLGSYAPASRQANTAAQQSLAALEAAAGQQLRGEGSSLAGELGKQLGQINAPNAGAVTSNLTNTANNAAASDYTSGNAQLQSLVEQGQHAADYIDKLPGIAGLAGLQNVRDLTAATNRQLADQLGQTSAQIPSAIQSLLGQMQANELSKASARRQASQFAASQNATAAANAARLKEQQREFNLTAKANGIKIANSVKVAKIKAKSAAEAAAAKSAQTDIENRLRFAKTYGYDPVTGQTIAGYKQNPDGTVSRIPSGKGSGGANPNGPKPPTANEINAYIDAWKNGKPTSVTTIPKKPDGSPKYVDANGNPKSVTQTTAAGQLSYQQAYRRLRAMNVPDKQARQYLDSAYKRGDQGRAWLTNEEQATLRKAGLQPKVSPVKTKHGVRGFLTTKQYQALRKAGLNPPGSQYAEGFLIAPAY